MTDEQGLPPEPGHEVDLTCGLVSNPCRPFTPEDSTTEADGDEPEVNNYDIEAP